MSKNENKAKSSCFVVKIDLSLSDKLQTDLTDQGFQFSKPPYTIFSAQKKGVSVSLYESGKLTVQGKEMGDFIEMYLEPEIIKSFTYSYPEEYVDKNPHMGSDEAGKGDFFGALCIAAVYADGPGIIELVKMGVKDTKVLSDKKTLDMAKKIRENFAHHIIKVGPVKYNELYAKFNNLNTLLAWAHSATLENLGQKTGCEQAIVDQFASQAFITPIIMRKNKGLNLILKTHAEADPVVAAAAILARAAFLNNLKDLGEELGIVLPKGASQLTKKIASQIVKQHGAETLDRLCKKHFQTYKQVLEAC